MTELPSLFIAGGFLVAVFLAALLYRAINDRIFLALVWDYETALLFRYGKLVKSLDAGRHRLFGHGYSVLRFDKRLKELVVQGQEMLTADKVSVKLTAIANYRLIDAYKLHQATAQGEHSLYSGIQMALRKVVGGVAIDDLIEGKAELSAPLLDQVRPVADLLGLELVSVDIRDLILAGELKRAYAAVVQSRKEALAALEKARGEAAKLRTLANAARLFENHPQLLQMRYLDTLDSATGGLGNTVVFASPEDWAKVQSSTTPAE